MHRGPSGRPALEDTLPALSFGLRHVPALAHRLDHDTTGCLVLARHPKALTRLGRLFGAGLVEKTYRAITSRAPEADEGTIELPLAKRSTKDGWHVVVDATRGKPARTIWRVLDRGADRACLELRPLTGRTHQIRAHLAALGCPILGDAAYGGAPAPRALLHAYRVAVPYWQDRPPVTVEAPLPKDFG